MRKIGLLFGFCLLAIALFGQEPRLVLPIGHTDYITDSEFSPDNTKVLTASRDRTAKLWDVKTGQLLLTFRDSDVVSTASFSPDGKKIVSISNDAKIWDAETGSILMCLKDTVGIGLVIFSPDEKRIGAVSGNSLFSLRDAITGKIIMTYKNFEDIKSARYLGNGKKILLNGQHVTVIDEAGNLLFEQSDPHYSVKSSDLSADEQKILSVSNDSSLCVFSMGSGKLLFKVKVNSDDFSGYFSPDGKEIMVNFQEVSSRKFVNVHKIIAAETGKVLFEFEGLTTRTSSAQFSPNAKQLFTVSDGDIVKILNAEKGGIDAVFPTGIHWAWVNDFSANGKMALIKLSNEVQIWDIKSFSLLSRIKGHTRAVNRISFSPKGRKLLTASADGTAKTWDVQNGGLLTTFRGHTDDVLSSQFSPDGKIILTASLDSTVKTWDEKTGTMLTTTKENNDFPWSAQFTPDGEGIIYTLSHKITISNTKTKNILFDLDLSSANDYVARLSPDEKKLIIASYQSGNMGTFADVYDMKTKEKSTWLAGFPTPFYTIMRYSTDGIQKGIDTFYNVNTSSVTHKAPINDLKYSLDGKRIVTASNDRTAKIWNAKTGILLDSLIGHEGGVLSAQFSSDGKKVVTGSSDCTAKLWYAETGNLLKTLRGHVDVVKDVVFSPDDKRIATCSADNTNKIWDVASGKLIYTFFAVDSNDYFNQIPSGYYMCSQNAAKLLHYVTKNLEVITFDQLDIKYNRPDKVLEAIGCPDTALIHAYRRAYEKRIKKLGIDTTSFKSGYSVPKADLLNRDQIEQQPEQKKDQLSLHIAGSDSTYNLDRFNVWVNQVPVYGIRGISLKNRNKNTLDTAVTITLSQGDNRIETSVTDANGTESYHIPLYVKYVPDKQVDTLLHFVGIGINKFKDKNYNLSWSVKDIRDLALKFKEKYGSKCTIDTLFDENVTTAKVVALKDALLKSGVNDKVVLAYSGHGLLSKDYDYFLSTYSVNFKDPAKDGLPYDALENLLDSIPARKKLMLIDACHSGEVDKEEMNRYQQTANERKKNGLKGAEIEFTQKSGMSMASSFELMKQLFVNVGKSTGATIISAAGGVQYALEKNDLQNGVFTYSILENMQKNPHVNISALKQYVNKRVTELTAGMQVPTTRNETDVVDWEVW